jgi:hypothetical protein
MICPKCGPACRTPKHLAAWCAECGGWTSHTSAEHRAITDDPDYRSEP